MERTAVESSNVASIGYDADAKVLEVEFKSGGIYQYAEVPASVHKALMGAPSAGRHVAAIVTAGFACTKVEPEDSPGR